MNHHRNARDPSHLRSEVVSSINVTPMVDVMLVLLVIFMVVTPVLATGFQALLPELTQGSSRAPQDDDVVLGVDAHGALYLRGVPVAADSIEARLAAIYAFRAKDRILYLRADRRVRYGVLLRAMAAARDAGVRVVAAVAEPRPAPPEGARGGP